MMFRVELSREVRRNQDRVCEKAGFPVLSEELVKR